MESVVLHWVIQSNAQTRALLTFASFADYADAERHKAQLERFSSNQTSVVEIVSLPVAEFPK
jgi:hypothetical protein